MKEIILGTAGHIDHGKTSLIRAVTGVNTDRLKEEKRRGITIELGFADVVLPSGQHLGIVDVPGHEKFVKNMVAGATGIDMVAMVIAADEGVMPQTREHMEICTLLGVRHGMVVLTKIDMVDEEWLELVTDDIQGFVEGTFLEGAPIIPVSSATGQGIEDFTEALDQLAATVSVRRPTGLFRLPVDRVFTMKGFGTVITGTLASGQVSVGDPVMLFPSGITSKVRGLQVHNASVNTAVAGQRTAINFQGLEKASVSRGEVVAAPQALMSSYMVDVSLHYLASNPKPIKNRTRVRFHTGTNEIMGLLILLEGDELAPGQDTLAQIRLESPVALVRDDRYVLRSYSPVRTIGGGPVINPIAAKHKRQRPEVLAALKAIAGDDATAGLPHLIADTGYRGCPFAELQIMTNLPAKKLDTALQQLLSKKEILLADKESRTFLHASAFAALQTALGNRLADYHQAFPLKTGMPKEELKSKLPKGADARLFTLVLNQLLKDGAVAVDEDMVRLSDHSVTLAVDQQQLRQDLIDIYRRAGLTPPYFKEVQKDLDVPADQARQVLELLVAEELLIKIKEDLYYHSQPLNRLRDELVAYLTENGEITTPQFKDMTGASRKFVIALIEHFDATQLTIRIGDIRKLRRQPQA